jgi:hypothetical protein
VRGGVITFALAGAALASQPAPAATSTLSCGSQSIGGPGSLIQRNGPGPACLLHAFQLNCRPATYRLISTGVDTVGIDTFRTIRRAGTCRVAVTISFRVVPQAARLTGNGFCRRLRRKGSDIVAGPCAGAGLPASVSLESGRPA